jgi:hypothetical protein
MVTVNALFAGFVGVLAGGYAFAEPTVANRCPYVLSITSCGLAFWLFAWAAEMISDALDEDDVKKYFRSMLLYNFGVVLLFLSVPLNLWANLGFRWWQPLTFLPAIVPWLRDILWIVWNSAFNKAEIDDYIENILLAPKDS